MNNLLSALPDFLSTAAGKAVFAVVIVVLIMAIVALNYRLFMKNVLDFLAALVSVIVLSPVFLGAVLVSKRRLGQSGGTILTNSLYIGKRGKLIYVRSFTVIHGGIGRLPRLLDVLAGKLSFVGPRLMEADDAALIDDEIMDRFSVRPGLISPAVCGGCETYEEMFDKDLRYVKRRGFFKDCQLVILCALHGARGEGSAFRGEAAETSYARVLLARGTITKEQAAMAHAYAEEAVRNARPFR